MALTGCVSAPDIYQIMVGYQKSQILHTSCSLGLFEVLYNAPNPMTSNEMANSIDADPDAMERLLNACVGLNLMEVRVDANGIATYRNSPAADKFLIPSSGFSMKAVILMQGDFYKLWGRLGKSVKEGAWQLPSIAMGNNNNGPSMFEKGSGHFMCNEEKQVGFMQSMHLFSRMDSAHILNVLDLGEFDSACDLGGGTGAFALDLATRYREMHVTVMELEHVVEMSSHFLPKAQPKNLRFAAGDFFKDPLPTADLYILSHVIHDWNVAKIHQLLSKVYKSLRSGGALLLCEKMLFEAKTGPVNTLLFDLGMLLCSEGKERTAEEYGSLLEQHGFCDLQFKQLPELCFRDAILAKKP